LGGTWIPAFAEMTGINKHRYLSQHKKTRCKHRVVTAVA